MPYYWTIESWGSAYPPEDVGEVIDWANYWIDQYAESHPDADEAELAAYSEALWDRYCTRPGFLVG